LDALPPMSSGSIPRAAPARRRTATRAMGALALLAVTVVVAQQVLRQNRATTPNTADSLVARDIGPGGDRTGTAQIAAVPPSTSSAVRPETVVVYRNNSDSESGIQVPVVISRAESLAIADAVRKRIAATPKPDTTRTAAPAKAQSAAQAAQMAAQATTQAAAVNESRIFLSADGKTITMNRMQLAEEIGKIFADSVAIALSRMDTAFKRASRVYQFESPVPSGRGVMPLVAPPSDGRVRIVVSNYTNSTGKREMSSVSRDIAQYLRAGLPTDTYDVVSTDLLERAARYGMNDPISLGFSLRADYVVSGLVMQRADSIVVVTQFRDVRDGRFSRAQEAAASAADPKPAYQTSLALVNGWLDTVKVLRTRRPSMPKRPQRMLEGSRGAPRGAPPENPRLNPPG
jgi:serine/threonine-protein kinase